MKKVYLDNAASTPVPDQSSVSLFKPGALPTVASMVVVPPFNRFVFSAEADKYVVYEIKPNFKSIGPKFGKLAPQIKQVIKTHSDRGRVVVNFRKVDGSLRRIVGTTNLSEVPSHQWPRISGLVPPTQMAIYDLEKNDWRRFVLLRVINMATPGGTIIYFNNNKPGAQVA